MLCSLVHIHDLLLRLQLSTNNEAPFIRKVYLSSTQSTAFRIDLETIIPGLLVSKAAVVQRKTKADKEKAEKAAKAKAARK